MAVQCASFPMGVVVITPNALDQLTPADVQLGLQRHQRVTGVIWARKIGKRTTTRWPMADVCYPAIAAAARHFGS